VPKISGSGQTCTTEFGGHIEQGEGFLKAAQMELLERKWFIGRKIYGLQA
jgi:hypothetical protein